MTPKVTICMPTYNFERYLPEAIESVLAQDFRDYEFLIIDDCSSDTSAAIISGYAKKDTRITAFVNGQNVGMVNNWNLCMQRARGSYIKFLFGDDELVSPGAIARMVQALESDHRVSLVTSARRIIDERSREIKVASAYREHGPVPGTDIITDCLLERLNKIGEPSAVMFRKEQAGRGFDARYRQLVDLEMWFHLLEQGMFVYETEPLVAFRVHSEQQTRQNIQKIHLLIGESFLLLDEYSRKPYINLSRVKRGYMNYLPFYSIWKHYKQHRKLSRQEALEYIRARYSLAKFVLFYPFFKLYKFYRRSIAGEV